MATKKPTKKAAKKKAAVSAPEIELGVKTRQQLEIRLGQITSAIDRMSENLAKWLATK